MYRDIILRKGHSYDLGALGALTDFRQVVSISIDQRLTRVFRSGKFKCNEYFI